MKTNKVRFKIEFNKKLKKN